MALTTEATGGQKEPITIDQAAKLFTLDGLGLSSHVNELSQFQGKDLHSGTEIDSAYNLLLAKYKTDQKAAGDELTHWRSWFSAATPQALAELAQKGYMLQTTTDGTGNTEKTIDYFDTDRTLNRGDFESPDFNGGPVI